MKRAILAGAAVLATVAATGCDDQVYQWYADNVGITVTGHAVEDGKTGYKAHRAEIVCMTPSGLRYTRLGSLASVTTGAGYQSSTGNYISRSDCNSGDTRVSAPAYRTYQS